MGILSFFKRNPRVNHTFDEKDRELSAERRRLNIEIENLKRKHAMEEETARHALKMAEIEEELAEYADDEDDASGGYMSPEDMLAMKLIDKIGEPKQQQTQTITSAKKKYTDEEIKALWGQISPTHKAYVPKCTDEQIREFAVKMVAADADDDSLNRMVAVARTEALKQSV